MAHRYSLAGGSRLDLLRRRLSHEALAMRRRHWVHSDQELRGMGSGRRIVEVEDRPGGVRVYNPHDPKSVGIFLRGTMFARIDRGEVVPTTR